MRLYLRSNIDLNGSITRFICNLSKIKTKLILTIYRLGITKFSRVEYYIVDDIVLRFGLTDTNRRNLESLVIPEFLGLQNLVFTVFALNNLIGYAAAIRVNRFRINSPVRYVDLNHLGISSAIQVVKNKLIVVKRRPITLLHMILKFIIAITDAVNFVTLGGAVHIKTCGLLIPSIEYTSLPENIGFLGILGDRGSCKFSNSSTLIIVSNISCADGLPLPSTLAVCYRLVSDPALSRDLLVHSININFVCAITARRCNFICRRIAYCIIILRIIFIGTAIIASLLDVRTAGRCLCRILSLRLSLGLSIGSFLNGVFCGNTVNNRHLVFRCRKGGDASIDGQRPGWAHGQRHDSRKCSCEQTFAHILF